MITRAQERKFREILKQVNVSEICKDLNNDPARSEMPKINIRAIYRVLDGEGKKLEDLVTVIERAKEIIADRKKKIQSL
jgi:hypothetical protein